MVGEMASFLYLRCNGGDYFTGSAACPLDGWSGAGFVEGVGAADALAQEGLPVTMAALRQREVPSEALDRSVIMEFPGDEAPFDAISPKGYVIKGVWTPFGGHDLL